MFQKITDSIAYDLHEAAIALEQIIDQCGGPTSNNPLRLDLTALERVKGLITQTVFETEFKTEIVEPEPEPTP